MLAFFLHCAHVATVLQRHRQRHRTLTFDDPGIGAELPLVFNHIHAGGADQNDFDVSVTKPITPTFSLTAETDYLAAKWLGGDLYWLAILPITASVVFLLLLRSLARRYEVTPFLWSILIFIVSLIGLTASLFPYIAPPGHDVYTAAAPSNTLASC